MDNNTGRRAIIAVALITSFIATFTGSALNLSIPAIGKEFAVGAIAVSWIVNGYILASAAMAVPFGRLADLTDRRQVLNAGILIFAIASGATALVHSFVLLLFLRVVQGVGAAMVIATNQALLISAFPPERRGRVLGYSIAATYSGLTAGPVVGGLLNQWFGWRSILLVTMIVCLTAGIISLVAIPKTMGSQFEEVPAGAGKSRLTARALDIWGGVLYVATITLLIFGFSAITEVPLAKFLLLLSPVCLAAFIRNEQKAASPIIQVRLFRKNRNYLFANLAALLNYGATFALGYLLSIYLQVVRGIDSGTAGLILISQPLVMAILSPLAGRLSDKVSPFRLASLGMALCTVGLLLFSLISLNMPVATLIVLLIVGGVGFALFSSPNTNAVMGCVQPKDYSVASSVLGTMRAVGQSASMATVSFVFAVSIGDVPFTDLSPLTLVAVMRTLFLIFSGVCAVGIVFALGRR